MLTKELVNAEEIKEILLEIVKTAFDNIKNEAILLYIDRDELNIMIATEYNEDFQEAIRKNFLLDEEDEIIDEKGYYELLRELQVVFIEMYKTCGLFDFFPAGKYKVNGETRHQESDCVAPKGKYYAPFEDAIVILH
jgi:hypothetical protein